MAKSKIPGLTFSAKRASGSTRARQRIARATGIPTTKRGRQRKIEHTLFGFLFGRKK